MLVVTVNEIINFLLNSTCLKSKIRELDLKLKYTNGSKIEKMGKYTAGKYKSKEGWCGFVNIREKSLERNFVKTKEDD